MKKKILIPDIELAIRRRIKKRVKVNFFETLPWEVYLAGNSLNSSSPNDFDFFPVNSDDSLLRLKNIICKTKNAITFKIEESTVQFCKYHHESLKELVDSFDFSHIQIGAYLVFDDKIGDYQIKEIYFTDAWIESKILENSNFVSSDYPLSSLIRSYKYAQRNDLKGKSYIGSVIKILAEIVKRGFKDYEDFKDQIDAVDLGLLPDDFEELRDGSLIDLFNSLKKKP